ncbi:MAG TPA: FG-GAP-like repeat-containing protein, partial [Patescibacteria group bacterium]|nr:FG-GAP-like repeat-containing protein [Patescibacteria group bacterium]
MRRVFLALVLVGGCSNLYDEGPLEPKDAAVTETDLIKSDADLVKPDLLLDLAGSDLAGLDFSGPDSADLERDLAADERDFSTPPDFTGKPADLLADLTELNDLAKPDLADATVPPDLATSDFVKLDFLLAPPIIGSVTPTAGAASGGMLFTVNGSGFQNGATIQIGGKNCTNVSWKASTQIQGTIPSSVVCGKMDVVITNPDGQKATAAKAFSYICGNVNFASSTLANTAGTARSVTTADLNRDGNLDLVVVNETANNLTIFLGDGKGGFTSQAAHPPVGAFPFMAAVKDVNGDNLADVVVTNRSDGTISVLMGKGDGTFQTAISYPCGPQPYGLVLGDWNGDGRVDAAVVNRVNPPDAAMTLVFGKGGGVFDTPVKNALYSYPFPGIQAVDLNGDGKLSLVAAVTPASVLLFVGNGSGSFQAPVSLSATAEPHWLVADDLNRDGRGDVAASIADSANSRNGINVFLGQGNSVLHAAVGYDNNGAGYNADALVSADLNSDNAPELVLADTSASTLSIYTGTSAGTYSGGTSRVGVAFGPRFLASGDWDSDGKTDLV